MFHAATSGIKNALFRHGYGRHALTLLLLWALIFNLMASVAMAQNGPLTASQGAALTDNLPPEFTSYVVCTPQGLKHITMGADGQPLEQDSGTTNNQCLFCLPLNHLGPLPLDVDHALTAPVFYSWSYPRPWQNRSAHAAALNHQAHPRAPPRV